MILSQVTTVFGQEDLSWLASEHGTMMARSITLRTASFTAGTHYPQGFFLPGWPLGKITASGLYAPYNNANADGTEVLVGFLFTAVSAPADTAVNVPAALLDHCRVIEAKLPGAVDAPGKVDVAGRIWFV